MTDNVFDFEAEKAKAKNKVSAADAEQSRSEQSVADAFTREFGQSLKYDHHAGTWYRWTGIRWEKNETHIAFFYAREMCRMLADGSKALLKMNAARAVEVLCQRHPEHAVTSQIWDQEPMILGTPDGIVDLRTGKMSVANPACMITKITACGPRPGDAPLWRQFLADATDGDEQMQVYLQRVAGYCLTGLTTEHALFFVFGPGGNGKSVFLNILIHILAEYALTAGMEVFTANKFTQHSTDLAMLKGARLVTASETEEGKAWAEARIKALTGGDPITARFMRQNNFTFKPEFKLLFAGNHQPTMTGNDPAMRRRMNMLPFIHKPSKPDPLLEERLKLEAPQILSWMLQGCLDWQAGGLGRPESVTAATDEYFDDQDVFGRWIAEQCETGSKLWDLPGRLFASWKAYAIGLGEDPGTSVSFAGRLKKAGFRQGRSNSVRSWQGIILKDVTA